MRRIAFVTTTAAVALFGVAAAEETAPAVSTEANQAQAQTLEATESEPLQEAMFAYATFQSDISNLRSNRIASANELESALETSSRHNREQLTRGFVAYGAYTAAQSPEFVQGVRDAAAYYGRDAVIWAIAADTRYARGLRGGEDATRLVLDAATADSARVIGVADRYQELAYGLQRQRWANGVARDQSARVQRVRDLNAGGSAGVELSSTLSAHLEPGIVTLSPTQNPTVFGGRRFWDAAADGQENAAESGQIIEVASAVTYSWRVNETRGDAVNRMTSIAAMQALDATDEREETIDQLMTDPRSRDCLEMAQLQLYQCMSAARFRYENAFCMGQHAMRDVGQCFGDIAEPGGANMSPIVGAAATPVAARH